MKRLTFRRTLVTAIGAVLLGVVPALAQAQAVTMHAATQFNDEHDYNRTLKKFGELVTKYYGKPVEVIIHGNSELGVERDYAKFMNQGISVDVSILAGSNMSNFTKAAPLLDVPFVFRDRDHWNAVIAKGGMKPLFDIIEQQSGMTVIGICGGSTRNIVANRPVRNMKEMAGFKMRVIGAPIQGKIFGAFGAKPSVIAYNEVYNAIQSGVIEGLENEAPAMLNSKFYEVAPEVSLTQHAVVTRLLVVSGKSMKKYPADLQAAILKAGAEAGAFNRDIQATEDKGALDKMVAEKKARTHVFTERAKLLEISKPIVAEFAKEAGVDKILADMQAVK
jgi:TRAP-type C4-dicarboxylate transport system substrate-binding protein